MKNRTIYVLIGIIVCAMLLPIAVAQQTGVTADQQLVTITPTDTGLLVNEDVKITNNAQTNLTLLHFWIQQDASTVSILAGPSNTDLAPFTTGNIRTCNLTTTNMTIAPTKTLTIKVTYYLPSNAQNFEQTLVYDTTLLTVTYNDQTLFQGEHLLAGTDSTNTLQIRLYKPSEAPLSMTVIIILFIIVVAILGVMLLLLQHRRSKTKKTGLTESEETLTTKKTLLLGLLKDLEKQYRAKSISDETYTKLKDEYKQQAVDAMKRLEDVKK